MWDQRYSEPGFAYGEAPNDFLAAQAARLSGPVLCLAEGEGRNAVFLARRGLSVRAVDQSAVGLQKAAALAAAHGTAIETQTCDLADLEIAPESWGGVVSIWCHVPPPLRQALHRRVVAGLRPGGVLILEAYTPDQVALGTGGPPVPALCMTLSALRQELAGLDLVVAQELRRDIQEGKYHRGLSAVVQIVATKPSALSAEALAL